MKANLIFIVILISSCVFEKEPTSEKEVLDSLEFDSHKNVDFIGHDLFINNCCLCHAIHTKSISSIPFIKFKYMEDSFKMAFEKVKGDTYHEKLKIDSLELKEIYIYIDNSSIQYNRN